MSDQRTVRVATCRDSAEVMLIRSVLEAHGINPIIPGEVSAALGPHLVAFSTPVFVDVDDAEQASALIAEIREQKPADEGDEGEGDEGDTGEGDEGTALAGPDVAVVVERRKRMGASVLLALVITFGTGHMSTGAWKRGVALAALEIVGIRHAAAGSRWGVVMVAAAVLLDLVGSILRVRRYGAPSPLPLATVKRR